MKTLWDSFTLFNYSDCKNELHKLALSNTKVKDLEGQVVELLSQIKELKAINHYQTYELEKTITKLEEMLALRAIEADILEEENHLLKEKIEARKKRRADRLKAKREQKEKQ